MRTARGRKRKKERMSENKSKRMGEGEKGKACVRAPRVAAKQERTGKRRQLCSVNYQYTSATMTRTKNARANVFASRRALAPPLRSR